MKNLPILYKKSYQSFPKDAENVFFAVKKPIVIKVLRLDEPSLIETKEGTMTAKTGDYLLEGVEGEVYAVDKDIFEKTYVVVDDSPNHKLIPLDPGDIQTIMFATNMAQYYLLQTRHKNTKKQDKQLEITLNSFANLQQKLNKNGN